MTARGLRNALRLLHITMAGLVGTYIYSPWGTDPAFTLAVKIGLLPILSLSGLIMWQQGRLQRLINSN